MYAQQAQPQAQPVTGVQKKAVEGTFQLIQVTKIQEAVQDELLVTIESKREESRTVYYDLSPNTRVMILSRKEISQPGFKPLEKVWMDN